MQKNRLSNKIPWDRLLGQDTEIIVGCSGGADSVCLLLLLAEEAAVRGLRLRAVHVNHCLRGEESDEDEKFVRDLCRTLGVTFKCVSVDVAGRVAGTGESTEEAARFLRYKALREEAGGHGLIAVAHNSDDQAETVLWNIIRGCDIKGLSGMKEKSGSVIRPLLRVSRAEIEDYLAERGQKYRIDSTNNINDYTRNKIRNELLPYIREQINSGVSEHLNRLAESAQANDAYMQQQLREFNGRTNEAIKEGVVPEETRLLAPALALSVIYEAVAIAAGAEKDIERKHIEAVLGLFDSRVGARLNLPYGLVALRRYKDIRIAAKEELSGEMTAGAGLIEAAVKRLNDGLKNARVFEYKGEQIPDGQFLKWFDYDIIFQISFWRTLQPGDYIILSGGVKKTLNRFMIDEKIPRDMRRHLPLLACGSEIVWIPGYRIGESFKITDKTKRVIEIKYEV